MPYDVVTERRQALRDGQDALTIPSTPLAARLPGNDRPSKAVNIALHDGGYPLVRARRRLPTRLDAFVAANPGAEAQRRGHPRRRKNAPSTQAVTDKLVTAEEAGKATEITVYSVRPRRWRRCCGAG